MLVHTLIAILILSIPLATLRLLHLQRSHPRKPTSRKPGTPTRLLIVLGSGGHTAEMLSMLQDLDTSKYTHRSYVVSSGDAFSARKAQKHEQELLARRQQHGDVPGEDVEHGQQSTLDTVSAYGSYDIATVPRARRVHQPLWSTPWTSLQCLRACFAVLRGGDSGDSGDAYPDLIITNGPGTGVMVVFAAVMLRMLVSRQAQAGGGGGGGGGGGMRTIYVESWARVRRLSLSGRILLRVVDRFLVQWETLLPATRGKGEFLGCLVY